MCLYFLCVCMWKVCCYTPRAIIRRLRTTCTRIESVGGELLLFYLCVCIFFDFFFFPCFLFYSAKKRIKTRQSRETASLYRKKKTRFVRFVRCVAVSVPHKAPNTKIRYEIGVLSIRFFFFLFFVTSTRITNGVWKMVFFFCCYFRRVKLRFTRKSGSHFFFSTKLVRI